MRERTKQTVSFELLSTVIDFVVLDIKTLGSNVRVFSHDRANSTAEGSIEHINVLNTPACAWSGWPLSLSAINVVSQHCLWQSHFPVMAIGRICHMNYTLIVIPFVNQWWGW